MRRVVIDTNVALPAIVGRGNAARLWALLAYGALHHRARSIDAEAAALERFAAEHPDAVVRGPNPDLLRERYVDAIARIDEQLGIVVPTDLIMVSSDLLLDEYQAKLTTSTVPGTPISPQQSAECRYLVTVMSADICLIDPTRPTIVETDPDDDIVLHTAWNLDATLVVSDDKRHLLNRDGSPRAWTDPTTGRITNALSLRDFISDHINTSSFEISELDIQIATSIPRELNRLSLD